MGELLEAVAAAAHPFGLNLIAAVATQRYDVNVAAEMRAETLSPSCRSIVVIANGGGAFWQAFQAHANAHAGWFERENPLDDFTRLVVERHILPVMAARGADATPVFPFMSGRATLNFMELGKAAGLAGPSIIGVMLNPVYGPWIAFRAALLLNLELDGAGDAPGFDPCRSCTARTCIPACPAGAVTFPAGWDVPGCVAYRVENEAQCAPRCHSRVACVIGPEHRYPDEEIAYHQMRALRSMRPWYEAHIRNPRA